MVVLKWTRSGWKYLTLITQMRNREGNFKLDFPKGHVEGSEDWMEAAVRETGEESGIRESDLNFAWGDAHIDCVKPSKTCRMFIAWTGQRPEIRRNPASGVFEHIGWKWLSLAGDPEEGLIHAYIRPAVQWARTIVRSGRLDSLHGSLLQQEPGPSSRPGSGGRGNPGSKE